METLFLFEIFVDFIRVDGGKNVSDELALGVRLLDFPTLLIYPPERRRSDVARVDQGERDKRWLFTFNRGKSCVFKMNMDSVHTQLSTTPLYAMVLDVKEEIPKLVGSCLISLAKVVDRIRQDVTRNGVSTHSSHGERVIVGARNLTGETVGCMSVSYKLITFGGDVLPHLTVPGGQNVQKDAETTVPSHGNTLVNVDKQDISVSTQTEQMLKANPEAEKCFQEDSNVFCPPHLYYSHSAEEGTCRHEERDYKLSEPDTKCFTLGDTLSEDEVEHPDSPHTDQAVGHTPRISGNQEAPGAMANVLGDALRQLPLLNALLIELSQLHGQNTHQPLSVHPNLAWIYRPASSEPTGGRGAVPPARSSHDTRRGAGPHLKHSRRSCSAQRMRPESEGLVKNKPQRKQLVFGTTKTFHLRRKKNSSAVKRPECEGLIEKESQSNQPRTKAKCLASAPKKSALRQSHDLSDSVTSVQRSIAEDSHRRRQENIHANKSVSKSHDRESEQMSENTPPSAGDREPRGETPRSPSASDSHRGQLQSSRGSRRSSLRSGLSDPSRGGGEEADYADDFNSLELSDASSPRPASSPEPAPAWIPRTPAGLDPCASGGLRRPVLPVPMRARHSPQRALKGTHLIRSHESAPSLSSEDGERDWSASVQTVRCRTQTPGRSSVSDSGESSESVPGASVGSVSSCETQDADELQDDLGSLDFKKTYQHISELVANKLPGYTM